MPLKDPIRKKFFDALARAEFISDIIFYIGVVLSVSSVFASKDSPFYMYNIVMIGFGVCVLGTLFLGNAIKLYFSPRAEDNRRKDFFSNAMGVSLTHDKTDGYYNNEQIKPYRRMAAMVLENSLFSKQISLRMLAYERFKATLVVAVWLMIIFYRGGDYGFILAVSQAVFSEQIVAKWLKLEWLHGRFEKTYDRAYELLRSKSNSNEFNATVLDITAYYETSKSNASISLSSDIFSKINHKTSEEWENIKKTLSI
jgi:hypothetical protein